MICALASSGLTEAVVMVTVGGGCGGDTAPRVMGAEACSDRVEAIFCDDR